MSLHDRIERGGKKPAKAKVDTDEQLDAGAPDRDGEHEPAHISVREESLLHTRILSAALSAADEAVDGQVALTIAPPRSRPVGGERDPYSALKVRIHRACIAALSPRIYAMEASDTLVARVRHAVTDELSRDPTPLSREERRNLVHEITDDILGYGPLEPFLKDTTVTEIMVNGFDQIYVEYAGQIVKTGSAFVDDEHLLRIIDKIVSHVGRRIDEASPMVDARLPDGSRVNAIIPPLSLSGPVLTIRKFSHNPYTMKDLVGFGTVTATAARLFSACVRGKLNVLVSGGTGVGKTTMLNALSSYVGYHERIVTIEDAAELQLQQEHVIRLEARTANIEGEGEVLIRDLVRNALRMRPDRIIVGEVRGAETLDMLTAMNTGHEGSLTTIHANSPRDALLRLETLVLMAGLEIPLHAVREQVARAFDLVVHLVRLVSGERVVTHISEVLLLESGVIQMQDIFAAELPPEEEVGPATRLLAPLAWTGLRPQFTHKLTANGVVLPADVFEADQGEIARISRRRRA